MFLPFEHKKPGVSRRSHLYNLTQYLPHLIYVSTIPPMLHILSSWGMDTVSFRYRCSTEDIMLPR